VRDPALLHSREISGDRDMAIAVNGLMVNGLIEVHAVPKWTSSLKPGPLPGDRLRLIAGWLG
jgi:hypothetical protein